MQIKIAAMRLNGSLNYTGGWVRLHTHMLKCEVEEEEVDRQKENMHRAKSGLSRFLEQTAVEGPC